MACEVSTQCEQCRTMYIKKPIYVYPEMKLRGHVPNSYIHVSVSYLYIPRIGLPIWLKQNRQTNPGNINRSQIHECKNWETEQYNSVLEITRRYSFHFWEYVNQNQTFILDSHRPFICSASLRLCDTKSQVWTGAIFCYTLQERARINSTVARSCQDSWAIPAKNVRPLEKKLGR
jgi:hypothetical protein